MGQPERALGKGPHDRNQHHANSGQFHILLEAPPSSEPLRKALPIFFFLSLLGGVMLSPLAGSLPLMVAVVLYFFHRSVANAPRTGAVIDREGVEFKDCQKFNWTDMDRVSVHEFVLQNRQIRLARISLGRFKSGELRRAWRSDRPIQTIWRGARLIGPDTLLVNLKAFADGGAQFLNALSAQPNLMLSYENEPPRVSGSLG